MFFDIRGYNATAAVTLFFSFPFFMWRNIHEPQKSNSTRRGLKVLFHYILLPVHYFDIDREEGATETVHVHM